MKKWIAIVIPGGLTLAFAVLAVWGSLYVNLWYLCYLVPMGVWMYNGLLQWRYWNEDRGARGNRSSTGPNPHTNPFTGGPTWTWSTTAAGTLAGTDSLGTNEGTSLVIDREPFKAWKWGRLSRREPELFIPLNAHFPHYAVEDIAKCAYVEEGTPYSMGSQNPVPSHEIPDVACACGFYGLKDRTEALTIPRLYQIDIDDMGEPYLPVMLEVEFYGLVLVHTEGYRAQKQRVLAMHVPATDHARLWKATYPTPPTEWQWMPKGSL